MKVEFDKTRTNYAMRLIPETLRESAQLVDMGLNAVFDPVPDVETVCAANEIRTWITFSRRATAVESVGARVRKGVR